MGPKSNQVPAPFGPCHLWTRGSHYRAFPPVSRGHGSPSHVGSEEQGSSGCTDAWPNEIRDNGRERSGLSPGVFASLPQGFIGILRQGSCVEAAVIDSEALI